MADSVRNLGWYDELGVSALDLLLRDSFLVGPFYFPRALFIRVYNLIYKIGTTSAQHPLLWVPTPALMIGMRLFLC